MGQVIEVHDADITEPITIILHTPTQFQTT